MPERPMNVSLILRYHGSYITDNFLTTTKISRLLLHQITDFYSYQSKEKHCE